MSTLQVANIHFESTANNRIQYAGSNVVSFYTAGSESVRVDAGGNVAIGASNTDSKFSVWGGAIVAGGSPGNAAISWLGDVSTARWTTALGSYNLNFYNDSSAGVIPVSVYGVGNVVNHGATYYPKVIFSNTGTILAANSILSLGSGGGIGYGTGAGGTVTQATSKATGVTLNKACGQITMNNAALAATTTVNFILTNSLIASSTDLVYVSVLSGATNIANYNVWTGFNGSGQIQIYVRNISAGSLSEALVLGFVIIKSATA